jgi:hypothetical protein
MQRHAATGRAVLSCLLLALSCCCWMVAPEPACKQQVRVATTSQHCFIMLRCQLRHLQCIRNTSATRRFLHHTLPSLVCRLGCIMCPEHHASSCRHRGLLMLLLPAGPANA